MSYEKNRISDVVSELNRTIFLPAIQREFEWKPEQVEKLFDSIMADYPIGSFLFWKIREEQKKDWITYEFIRDYDGESPHNDEANLSGTNRDIYLILDGQQRLTSLLIGLKGSYRYFYYKWRDTKLYLNLFKTPIPDEENPEELVYQFSFRESPIPDNPNTEFWYEVGRILDFLDPEDAKENIEEELVGFDDDLQKNAKKLIGHLHTRIHIYPSINYFEETTDDYDKVVEIFIRSNTGGKTLEYSDILLSTATAKWKNLNAREEIHTFTDNLNSIGTGYRFGKDFVLKGSLYLTEDLPIQYKVKNFTAPNLLKIENNWENITEYLESTVSLVSKYGFNSKNITAAGALLPIAFYMLKKGKSKPYVNSSNKNDVTEQNYIQKWLILSLLKGAFGGSSDTTLRNVRDILLSKYTNSFFPYHDINRVIGIEPSFSEIELDKLFEYSYKTRYSFLILSLLYPNRDWKDNVYHEDHIFPKSEFSPSKLRKRGYNEERVEIYRKLYNTILNLQLLTNDENKSKNAQDFGGWIKTRDENFKNRHKIPIMESYDFDNFLTFIERRSEILKREISEIKFDE